MNPFISYLPKDSSSIQEEITEEYTIEENKFFFQANLNKIYGGDNFLEKQQNEAENNRFDMNFLENEDIILNDSNHFVGQTDLPNNKAGMEDQSLSTASSIISSQNEAFNTEEVKSMSSQKKEKKKKHRRKKNSKKILKRKGSSNNISKGSFDFFSILFLFSFL